MIEEELKQKKANVKSCAIRLVLSVIAYALGIFFLTIDADIGTKIILSILLCGLPSAIGRSSRKMEKLIKKSEGKTVIVVQKKKSGIIMKILKAIFNLVIGYIATPYLCYQYVMTIIRTQKEIKNLQGGGTAKVSGNNAADSQADVAQYDKDVSQNVFESKTENGATSDNSFVEVAVADDGNAENVTGTQAAPYVPIAAPVGNANLQTGPVATVGSGMVKIPVNPSWFAVVLAILPILVFLVKSLVQLYIVFTTLETTDDSSKTAIYFICGYSMLLIAFCFAGICYGLKSCISEVRYRTLNRLFRLSATVYAVVVAFLIMVVAISMAVTKNGVSTESFTELQISSDVMGAIIDNAIGPVLALIYYLYVRIAVFRESKYERKEAIPEDKKKKIATAGIVVFVVSVIFCFPIASSLSGLFSKGINGADEIELGMTKTEVKEILGDPYKSSENVYTYYNSSYAKKLDKINNADIDDIEDLEDLEDALNEEEEVINAYHYELVIEFVSNKVWKVSYRAYEDDEAVGDVEGDIVLKLAENTYEEFEISGLYAQYEVNYTEGWEKGYTGVTYDDISLEDITTASPSIKINWHAAKESYEVSGELYVSLDELDQKYGATKTVLTYYNATYSYNDYSSLSEFVIRAYDALLEKYGLYRTWLADFEK